jgi:Flp pilus assembly pilin Flp
MGLWLRATVAFEDARSQEGQTFAEYAVIIGIIAVALVAAIGTLRTAVSNAITNAATAI